jgi:hypothetical protein
MLAVFILATVACLICLLASSTAAALSRLQTELETISRAGRDEFIRVVFECNDPEMTLALLDTMRLTSPEAVGLLAQVVALRERGATEGDWAIWHERVKRHMRSLIGPAVKRAIAMPKRRKLNPAFKRLLIREFPDMELDEVLKLLDMGLLRLKKVRCAAMSRNPPRPCRAHALAKGLCRNHGALSTGAKTAAGRKRISQAAKRHWAKWRAEHGRPEPQ